ncbi:hypothetical protein BDW_03320 [Bdellovibrio bacteriovorus W]|nr:hypothetical protein BDW_03320 [Bdellovibrio bacteriovorus W]
MSRQIGSPKPSQSPPQRQRAKIQSFKEVLYVLPKNKAPAFAKASAGQAPIFHKPESFVWSKGFRCAAESSAHNAGVLQVRRREDGTRQQSSWALFTKRKKPSGF